MISSRRIIVVLPALAGMVLCAAMAARAARPTCILKSAGTTFSSPNTERPCTNNMNAYNGTKTLVDFNTGCTGGTYAVDVVFEQGPAISKLVSFQTSVKYNPSELVNPTCVCDPEDLFSDQLVTPECPATNGADTYLYCAEANLFGDKWPASNPNYRLMKVTFASLGFSEGATSTMSFYASIPSRVTRVTDSDTTVSDSYLDADVICTTPCNMVKAPTGATAQAGSVVGACTTTSGTRNVTVSFTKPTQCMENGASVACAAGCSPGTKVERVSPNPATLNSGTTSNSVTDTCTVDGTTTPYVYRLTGVCTSSQSACGSPTSITATLSKCECGPPPTPTNVKINGGDEVSSIQFIQGMPITITGTAMDSDTSYDDITVTLHYVSGGVVKTVEADIAPDKTFTVSIAGADVAAGQDIHFGLIQKDETGMEGPYPPGFDADDIENTGVMIGGESIIAGVKLDFTRQPYPNQFPFRAGADPLLIDFALNEPAIVTTRIYAADGSLIREISNSALDPEGNDNVCYWEKGCSWDGTSYLGGNNLVSNGLYIVNISAMGTGQNFGGQALSYTKGIVVMK